MMCVRIVEQGHRMCRCWWEMSRTLVGLGIYTRAESGCGVSVIEHLLFVTVTGAMAVFTSKVEA
jgi:hypothetical protein